MLLSGKKLTFFFLVLAILFFSQCKTIPNNDFEYEKRSPKMVYKPNVSRLNSDRTMRLSIVKSMRRGDPATHFKYTVQNVKTGEIIKEGSFRGMSIEWHDNNSLKLTSYVGMIRLPELKTLNDSLSANDKIKSQITIIKF